MAEQLSGNSRKAAVTQWHFVDGVCDDPLLEMFPVGVLADALGVDRISRDQWQSSGASACLGRVS